MRKRTLDNAKVIKIRLEEYRNRTYPILEGLKKRGYKIRHIDGTKLPFKVHEHVKKALGLH